jgi:predicted permease
MRWFHILLVRVSGGFGRRRLDEQLHADLEFHLEQQTLENLGRGMPPSEARRAAAAALGGVDSAKEACRDQRRMPLEHLAQDLKYSWRRLRRTPGFTIVAVLTLALGIGANSALFSLVNGILFRSPPIPNLDRLVTITETQRMRPRGVSSLSADEYRAIAESGIPSIEYLFVSDPLLGALSVHGRSDFVVGEAVSGKYFEGLGFLAKAGRLLMPSDDEESNPETAVVISDRLWRRWFNGDLSAIGAKAQMAGVPLTIVGVAPETFTGTWLPSLNSADLWVPVRAQSRLRTVQGTAGPIRAHRTFALLAPGATLMQVDAAVGVVGRRIHVNEPDLGLAAVSGRRGMLFDEYAKPGLLLGTALVSLSSLVLLIACANLMNLLLARASGRTAEIAIRLSFGASASRVFQLMLAEVLLLTALGGSAGLLVMRGVIELMTRVPLPTVGVTIQFDPSPDWRVLGFAFVTAVIAALAVGLIPAWRAARARPLRLLTLGGAGSGATAHRARLRTTLVAVQVMSSVVLLLVAGLYVRSAIKGDQLDLGYDVSSGATASVNMSLHGFDEPRGRRLVARMLEEARRIPGAERVSVSSGLPAVGTNRSTFLSGDDPLEGASGSRVFTQYLSVTPGFFETMRIPLRRGRDFGDVDSVSAPGVVIVSESLAAQLWPGQDALGRHLRILPNAATAIPGPNGVERPVRGTSGPPLAVVGVVADTSGGLRGPLRRIDLYRPLEQDYSPKMSVIVRTASNPAALVEPLTRALRSVDPDLAVFDARTVRAAVDVLLAPFRIAALVLGALGILGFGIAALGLYGVMAYMVAERRREFGIRMALGATAGEIYRGVIVSGLRMMLLGLLPGLAIAFMAASLLEHLIYGVEPHDALTFTSVPLLLVAVGLLAAAFAARKVSHIDPNVALREL